MKKSILVLTLILAFSPFSHSQTYRYSISHSPTSAWIRSQFSLEVSDVYLTYDRSQPVVGWICENTKLINLTSTEYKFQGSISSASCNIVNASTGHLLTAVTATSMGPSPHPETQTCTSLEGAVIDALHSTESPFCAIVGETGGPNSSPLFCQSTCGEVCVGIASGFQHFVSSNSCSAVTGPDGGNDDGGGDDGGCTENCNGGGDPTQPGDGGSAPTIPDTSGNPTTVQVNLGGTFNGPNGVTNVNLTLDQDFKPVTDRINETNARLNALQQGQQTTNSRLSDISSGISGLTSAIDGLNFNSSGIESGLSDINTTLQTGSYAGGLDQSNAVDFPGEELLTSNIAAVVTAIDQNDALFSDFNNLSGNLSAFDSIQNIFVSAPENCSPIPFGSKSLDLCGAASTSRSVLNWALAVILIIFLIRSVMADLKNVRLT